MAKVTGKTEEGEESIFGVGVKPQGSALAFLMS